MMRKGEIAMQAVECWGMFEVALTGRTAGNPFTDYSVRGLFESDMETVETEGFYDGDGVYRVRFMPSYEGAYRYTISGTFSEDTVRGEFLATAPTGDNHGPMRVDGCHFVYEDGTPFREAGTTCYAWVFQQDALVEQTLETLGEGYFNKMRFCIFPKHYLYNLHEPVTYPYEGAPCSMEGFDPASVGGGIAIREGNDWDFTRFNPAHFRRLDYAIARLCALGIEADLIVMHPYDRWGFSCMAPEQDDLYWRYVIARFSAYRNVWWSLANEYDLMTSKTIADWEHYAGLLLRHDRYRHLRSIHNCRAFYDYNRPWITHASIQRQDLYKCAELVDEYRARYGKPIVLDEIAYEGDISMHWGNITGEELVRRFWEAAVRGGYAGHGETFDRPDGVLWWSHGGRLHGDSPARIRFLRKILEETPGRGLVFAPMKWGEVRAQAEDGSGYYIYYFGFFRPCAHTFRMPEGTVYQVELIDTWNMTVESVGEHSGTFTIPMPRRQYIAARLRAII